ncbi:MAG: 16S rRNA (guanine(527)-N(7))-methyltransferase RsmG [Bacilli bacterium]|nr:16S rRNA (guanine(527)-N(7))-methyltransferase RsmG [Bacilli bacterium]
MDSFNLNITQKEQFEKYFQILGEENQKINLTSITKREEVYSKHFYDSLKLSAAFDFTTINKFLDIGSGAGFPGIPIKILHPHLELWIIEPTAKKTRFLKDLVDKLGLKKVEIITGRAEEVIVNFREAFPVVTARAVATLPVLLELCLPYVEVKGYFLAMKGSTYLEEVLSAKNAMILLDSEVREEYLYSLPDNHGDRVILKIRKNKRNKEIYPRKFAAIKKRHL